MADPVAVLTTAWSLECSFQGSVTVPEPTSVKLRVAGKPVLLDNTVSTWTVTACKAVSGNTPAPCSSVGKRTAGVAAKLSVGGQAVLLETFSALSVGSAVTANHTVSVSKSTPEPSSPLKVVAP